MMSAVYNVARVAAGVMIVLGMFAQHAISQEAQLSAREKLLRLVEPEKKTAVRQPAQSRPAAVSTPMSPTSAAPSSSALPAAVVQKVSEKERSFLAYVPAWGAYGFLAVVLFAAVGLALKFSSSASGLRRPRRWRSWGDWPVAAKVAGAATLVVVPMVVLVIAYILPHTEDTIVAERVQSTKQVIDLVYSLTIEYRDRIAKGEFTLEEGQRRAMTRIRNMRYDGTNYFFIQNLEGTTLIHPYNTALEGKNNLGVADASGKYFFKEMTDVARANGEGMVTYLWPRPGSDKPVLKITYVKKYHAWGWIFGTGVYADDIELEVAEFRNAIILGLSFALLLAVAIGLVSGRQIARPMQEVVLGLENADLRQRFNSTQADEIGQLEQAFDQFVSSIHDTLVEVSSTTNALASASAQISSSTEEMAAGSHEQTAQAGEVAGAVEEMTKTIIENSRTAAATADTTRKAKEAAELGARVAEDTIAVMDQVVSSALSTAEIIGKLGNSSSQIGEIIAVIDDIADQTNLLALNAAIEAARAGDQGRGFAVVADEVRKLAERTTKATKEIAGMIKSIQAETSNALESMGVAGRIVQEGKARTQETGVALQRIVALSQQVTDMVSQMAAAGEQQSSASEQISKNVEAISAVTGETASGTQQIARAAEDLNRLMDGLQQRINHFQLDDGISAHPAASAVLPSPSAPAALPGAAHHASSIDFAAAKSAHKMWRLRIQRMLLGSERLAEKDLVSHQDCQLGRWYYGAGKGTCGHCSEYAELGTKHEAMHEAVRAAVRAQNGGHRQQAEREAKKVYELSDQVVALIDRLAQVMEHA